MLRLKKLSTEEEKVIKFKATEKAFSGKYENHFKPGVYLCKQCGSELFQSYDKFDSRCGWPSFDDAVSGAIIKLPDKDGIRTEIQCSRCRAHLGHFFEEEGLTSKNIRYCVNSVSLNFKKIKNLKI